MVNRKRLGVSAILLSIAVAISGCATKASYIRTRDVFQKDVRNIGGIDYIPLARVSDLYKLDWSWDTFSRVAIIKHKDKRVSLREGSRTILVNGSGAALTHPPSLYEGAVYVPVSFAPDFLGEPPAAERKARQALPEGKKLTIKTVVIDPGHGGHNIGARSKKFGLQEKALTLNIARRLKAILEDKGLNVILTRDADRFVPLEERARIANRGRADLFVSVHANASRARNVRGFECFYLSGEIDDNARAADAALNAPRKLASSYSASRPRELEFTLWDMLLTENRIESRELARRICIAAGEEMSVKNRGVKSARFFVLKNTRIPSVLVEVGFLTNRHEARSMKEPEYVYRISSTLAKGILAYRDEFERTNGFTT